MTHFNWWKEYIKSNYKNMITKYIKVDPELDNKLKAFSTKASWSMSKIVYIALIEFFEKRHF